MGFSVQSVSAVQCRALLVEFRVVAGRREVDDACCCKLHAAKDGERKGNVC